MFGLCSDRNLRASALVGMVAEEQVWGRAALS
jgi:hypothetical protein